MYNNQYSCLKYLSTGNGHWFYQHVNNVLYFELLSLYTHIMSVSIFENAINTPRK